MKISSKRVEDLKLYAEEYERLSLVCSDPIRSRLYADIAKSYFEMLDLVVTYGFCSHSSTVELPAFEGVYAGETSLDAGASPAVSSS